MKNEAIKAIIFDMDGTMVDNMAVHNHIWMEYLQELGVQVDPVSFNDQTAGKTNPEIMRMFLGNGHSDERLSELGQEKETRYHRQYHNQVRPMDGLMEFLTDARARGLKLAVATSAPPDNVRFVLGELGLVEFFDAVVNGGEIKHSKPHPEIFLTTAERLSVPPEACLVFEDSRMGVEGALRAGMNSVLVTTGIPAEEGQKLPGVCKTIADFTEFSLGSVLR
jgi:beta-phosphoglucomutase family hydrolase